MKKLKIIIIILLLLNICLQYKNTQYHSQIIEKDNQIEKLKQQNLIIEDEDFAKEAYDISDEMIRFNYFGKK